jgi:hypothetical protein
MEYLSRSVFIADLLEKMLGGSELYDYPPGGTFFVDYAG